MTARYISNLYVADMSPVLLQPLRDRTLLGLNVKGIEAELDVIPADRFDDIYPFLDSVVEKVGKPRFGAGLENKGDTRLGGPFSGPSDIAHEKSHAGTAIQFGRDVARHDVHVGSAYLHRVGKRPLDAVAVVGLATG